MKQLLLIIYFALNCAVSKGQTKYQYHIKLQNVTNIAEAKMVTDVLRNYYKVYPLFNDASDSFHIISEVNISHGAFNQIATANGLVVLEYKVIKDIIKEEKEE